MWLAFLAMQQGDNFDETEHAHVAWLMGSEGKVPYLDFFQHHNPLTWDLLKIYYRMGGTGPAILYYGRALVVIGALIFVYGLTTLAKKWSPDGNAFPGNLAGILSIAFFSCAFPRLFVIRPETAGLTFFTGSLILWIRHRGDPGTAQKRMDMPRDFLAGMLFGAALYATPRFILLGGAFVLFPAEKEKLFDLNPKRLINLLLGGIVFILGYSAVMGYPLSQLYFNIPLSALLQKTGNGYYKLVPKLLLVALAAALILAWRWAISPREARRKLSLQAAYLLMLVVLSCILGAPLLYIQCFFAPIVCLTLLLTHAVARIDHSSSPTMAFPSVLCGLFILVSIHRNVVEKTTIADSVRFRNGLLALVGPSDKVLMRAALHPICVEDASFYTIPMLDYENRVCTAVQKINGKGGIPLPDCNYLKDIVTQRPVLLDYVLVYILPRSDREEFIKILYRDYYPYPPFADIGVLKERMPPAAP